jgi:hypothetical protein
MHKIVLLLGSAASVVASSSVFQRKPSLFQELDVDLQPRKDCGPLSPQPNQTEVCSVQAFAARANHVGFLNSLQSDSSK